VAIVSQISSRSWSAVGVHLTLTQRLRLWPRVARVRGEEGRLVAWFDEVALQSFGELAEDLHEKRSGSIWRFRLGNGLAGDAYTGKLSTDGSIFAGTSTHFGNGEYEPGRPAVPFVWRREPPAKTCSATPIS